MAKRLVNYVDQLKPGYTFILPKYIETSKVEVLEAEDLSVSLPGHEGVVSRIHVMNVDGPWKGQTSWLFLQSDDEIEIISTPATKNKPWFSMPPLGRDMVLALFSAGLALSTLVYVWTYHQNEVLAFVRQVLESI